MKKPINVEVADYKKLNAIRLKLTNQDPKARVVTFAEVIHQLLLEAGEWRMSNDEYVVSQAELEMVIDNLKTILAWRCHVPKDKIRILLEVDF